jgi:hypothetical protein
MVDGERRIAATWPVLLVGQNHPSIQHQHRQRRPLLYIRSAAKIVCESHRALWVSQLERREVRH